MVVGLASGPNQIEGLNPVLAAARYDLYAVPRPDIYEDGAFMEAVARQAGLILQPGGERAREGHQRKQAFLEDQLNQYSALLARSPEADLPIEQVNATAEQLRLQKTILEVAGLELILNATA